MKWPWQTSGKQHMPQLIFEIQGMHCASCAMNIDGELEDTPGVHSAQTSYARALCEIQFDPELIQPEKIQEVIQRQGYSAVRKDL